MMSFAAPGAGRTEVRSGRSPWRASGAGRVRGLGAVLRLALASCLLLVVGTLPAQAHAELESSNPADGAALSTAPTEVSFTFGEQLLAQGNAVTITDTGTGTRLAVDAPTVAGDTVSVPWPQQADAGQFRAAYRVVSADGHPINGSVTFTIEAPSASAVPITASEAPVAPPSVAASPVAAPSMTASPVPASTGDETPGSVTAAWVLGIGLVVLVGAMAITWSVRRNR